MRLSSIYCQNCRTANSISETHCQKCGIRLMLVVFPNSLQYDTNHVPTFYEDHLLERVTTLESQLGQTVEKLESAYEFINRCLELIEKDHIVLQSFLQTVDELNPELAETLSRRNMEIFRSLQKSQTAESNKQKILSEIQARHDNPNAELFTKLVSEAIDLFANNEEKEAFQMLERAALLSTQNDALFTFIAENYFRADKYAKAKKYLEKAFVIAPTKPKILIMLGAILADDGEIIEARRWLSLIIHHEQKSLAANYVWAMTAAFEANWTDAIAAFKQCAGKKEIAEIEYLIGCAYFQLKNEKLALAHLRKATELDAKFSDAFFMQSVIFKNLNDEESAENARRNAFETKESGAQCLEYLKKSKAFEFENALPFGHFSKKNAKILTGGALRLTNFFKKQILKSIE